MKSFDVKLITVTPEAESVIAYCARVSNPLNQKNTKIDGLIRYCTQHGHWSIFEQANMVLEITTSRAIAPQILRHRSFSFQEFSQRYAEVQNAKKYRARRQDEKNRQNSLDDLGEDTIFWFEKAQEEIWEIALSRYQEALQRGVAKECARALLPLSASTRLYMNGTVRSWIHYIQLRTGNGTQLEHREIAEACREIFIEQFPAVSRALGWEKSTASLQGIRGLGGISKEAETKRATSPSK